MMSPNLSLNELLSESDIDTQSPGNKPTTSLIGGSDFEVDTDPQNNLRTDLPVEGADLPLAEDGASMAGSVIPPSYIDVEDTPENILTNLKNISDQRAMLLHDAGSLVSDASLAKVRKSQETVNTFILDEMKRRGINATGFNSDGDVIALDEQGKEFVVDSSVGWEDLFVDGVPTPGAWLGKAMEPIKHEIGLGLAAASVIPATAPFAWTGRAIAGALGVASGRGVDLLESARELKYDLDSAAVRQEMIEAGLTDVALGVVGTGIFKVAGGVGRGTINLSSRGVQEIRKHIKHGQSGRAFQAMKDMTSLNDDQIISIVQRFERATDTKLISDASLEMGKLSKKEKQAAIQVVARQNPLMKKVVDQAEQLSTKGGVNLANEIAQNAKDFTLATSNATSETIPTLLKTSLKKYTEKVDKFYNDTKLMGIVKADNAEFDFSAIQKQLDKMRKTQSNFSEYSTRMDFKHQLDQLELLGAGTGNRPRSFADLLELRKVVNALSSDARFSSHALTQQLKATKGAIDDEIARIAGTMDEGDTWLEAWKQANIEYSKKLDMQTGQLYKAINKDQASPASVVRAIENSLLASDPTVYKQLFDKLTPRARRAAEGALIDQLNTSAGVRVKISNDLYATDWVKLNEKLKRFTFHTPEARNKARIVEELSEVLETDATYIKTATSSSSARPETNLATSVMGKLKQQFLNVAATLWQAWIPGPKGRSISLGFELKQLIENPLNSKAIKSIEEKLGPDPELTSILHKMQLEHVKFGDKIPKNEFPMYTISLKEKLKRVSNTPLGKGVWHYGDKETAEKIAKGVGAKVTTSYFNPRMFAQYKDVDKITRELYGRAAEAKDFKDKDVIDILKQTFDGIAQEDKVLEFKH